jgi:hypothetical protein
MNPSGACVPARDAFDSFYLLLVTGCLSAHIRPVVIVSIETIQLLQDEVKGILADLWRRVWVQGLITT